MSAIAADGVFWSKRRWIWTTALFFTTQVLLLCWLSDQKKSVAPTPPIASPFQFGLDTVDSEHLARLDGASDPTVFALANPHDFSGEAWLKMQTFPYDMTNRLESPRWLEDSPRRMAADAVRFAGNYSVPTFHFVEHPRPAFFEVAELGGIQRIQISMAVEGGLSRRTLISTNSLPVIDPSAVPTNCIIRVAVNADGYTFSPVLWTSCGYHNIDTNLIQFVKAARFQPIRTAEPADGPSRYALTLGNFIFRWSLFPAGETNRATSQR